VRHAFARNTVLQEHERVNLSLTDVVWGLTALAAVVVLLTRIRLGSSDRPAGRVDFARGALTTHTVVGAIALLLWVPGLALDMQPLLLAGLAAWWVVTLAGLMLLARWLPSHGRHAHDAVTDEWTEGPWLSVLAHVGMLIGIGFITWVVLIQGV
jgi:hypothetical protein